MPYQIPYLLLTIRQKMRQLKKHSEIVKLLKQVLNKIDERLYFQK